MSITWKPEYDLGIKEIDKQHEELIEIINHLNNSLHSLKSGEGIYEIFSELERFSNYHQKFEEDYFKKFNYEYAEEHIKEHRLFLEYLSNLKSDALIHNNLHLAFKLLDFLEDWLITHEQGSDKKYVECFKKNGL
ncbi:MAG: bacteriohemerythrin [Candidatus Pacebacteria bacterium]|nr:bacteriohemerythrin [Candidatus Paceibacterota bacterium]